jgi:uncharacterized protein (TIGR02271 family)
MVVAVFDDNTQAELAANQLENVGFGSDQLRFAGAEASTGGIGEKIKSLFTGQQTGGAYDDLVSMGVPSDDASYYQQQYDAGHSILAVLAGDRMQEATEILTRYGGYSAANRSGALTAENYSRTNVQDTGTDDAQSVKLREEQLRVQKQPVQTGEARLRKDVVTEQQSIDVPVTREEVYVERRPASGEPSDTPIGEGETYRVPVREEQVTVEKQPVVREEVSLGKRAVQDTQRVSDTVRREEAHIEREGDVNVQGGNVQDITDQTTP